MSSSGRVWVGARRFVWSRVVSFGLVWSRRPRSSLLERVGRHRVPGAGWRRAYATTLPLVSCILALRVRDF